MHLVQLFVPLDAAHDTVDQLGELGIVQFRDKNEQVNLFQRSFVNEVKRADDMLRKLRFFSDQIRSAYKVTENTTSISAIAEAQNVALDSSSSGQSTQQMNMDDLETNFDDLEKELTMMSANQDKLNRNYSELTEFRHVLLKDQEFFSSETSSGVVIVNEGAVNEDIEAPLLNEDESRGGGLSGTRRLGYLTGVINSANIVTFQRLLWRASRGNIYFRPAHIDDPLEDPQTGKPVSKDVFIIFFQGNRLQTKIKKICESFGAHLYPCPETARERGELLNKLGKRLEELQEVISKSNELRFKVLNGVLSKWDLWKSKVTKEKNIYHTMNMFIYDTGRRCLIAEGWCPVNGTDQVQEALKTANHISGTSVPSILHVVRTNDEPPTYYKTDKFTEAFQNIVDSYGVARYQEVNPAVFATITFPFLFAIMFGDLGHGFILTLFAAYLIWKEKSLQAMKLNEMIAMTFGGRYMLLLMGIFSMYVGLVYNDCFGVPLNIFEFGKPRWLAPLEKDDQYRWNGDEVGYPYPFGVDPTWKYKNNELNYYNSLKMKISIIFAVVQMSVGIFLSLLNGLHFRKPLNIFFEFIPQIIFLSCIFGYLVFLIIVKWLTDFRVNGVIPYTTPSLLTTMIEMFLKILSPIADPLFPGQEWIQRFLVVTAVFMVPLMLFPKPLLLRYYHNKEVKAERSRKEFEHSQGIYHHHDDEEASEEAGLVEGESSNGKKSKEVAKPASGGGGHGHGEEFDFGEIFIHQVIHTIEFVLGSVSNTASYLRLWALSLAHSELAFVFWSQIMIRLLGMKLGSPMHVPAMFFAFLPWSVLTVGVLLVMESLSAFLHALRLHWVEFMNKFYAGDGHMFAPFSYASILRAEEENEEAGKK